MFLFLKEPQLQMLEYINVQLVIFILLQEDPIVLCKIQLITWINKSRKCLIAIILGLECSGPGEIPMGKIGKEGILLKFASLHQMQYSTRTLGWPSTKHATGSPFPSTNHVGLACKFTHLPHSTPSSLGSTVVFPVQPFAFNFSSSVPMQT